MEETKIFGNAILKWFLSNFIFTAIMAVIIISLEKSKGINTEGVGDMQFFIMILAGIVAFYFFKNEIKDHAKVEIRKDKINIKYILLYLTILPAIGYIGDYIVILINNVLKLGFNINSVNEAFQAKSLTGMIMLLLYTVILAPIFEELIFRGYTINLFKKYGKKTAIILSAAMFGILHAEYMQILPAIMGGIVLGIIMIKTNDIRICIICHMVNNLLALLQNFLDIRIDYILIILALIVYFVFNKKEKLFEIRKSIKKEEYKPIYILKSPSLIIFLLICTIVTLSGLIY